MIFKQKKIYLKLITNKLYYFNVDKLTDNVQNDNEITSEKFKQLLGD